MQETIMNQNTSCLIQYRLFAIGMAYCTAATLLLYSTINGNEKNRALLAGYKVSIIDVSSKQRYGGCRKSHGSCR